MLKTCLWSVLLLLVCTTLFQCAEEDQPAHQKVSATTLMLGGPPWGPPDDPGPDPDSRIVFIYTYLIQDGDTIESMDGLATVIQDGDTLTVANLYGPRSGVDFYGDLEESYTLVISQDGYNPVSIDLMYEQYKEISVYLHLVPPDTAYVNKTGASLTPSTRGQTCRAPRISVVPIMSQSLTEVAYSR